MLNSPFPRTISPDCDEFLRCLRHQGTPARVHFIELFLDPEVKEAVCRRFDLDKGLDPARPEYVWQREIAIQRFLGYDYVRCGVDPYVMPLPRHAVADTASLARAAGRAFVDSQTVPG
jgi:hypothetical protein